MPEITKEDFEKANKLVADLQTELKNVNANVKSYEEQVKTLSAESRSKVEKIEAELKIKDAELQKAQAEKDAEKTKVRNIEAQIADLTNELKKTNSAEMLDRVKDLETELAKKTPDSKDGKISFNSVEYKALKEYVVGGENGMSADLRQKYLRTDKGNEGGFLVPQELVRQILEEVEEVDPIRPYARIFATKVKTLDVPIRQTLPVATFEGEAEQVGDSQSDYRLEQMTAFAQHINTPITWDMIEFSAVDMIPVMSKDAAMAFAISEGQKFLKGTGVKQPEGIMTNADIVAAATDTATNDVLSLTDVVKLAGKLKTGYLPNARYFMNQKTLFDLRAEKDTVGNFLWKIGGEGMPNNIAGIPFIILPYMDDVADGKYPVGIGDFFYGYYILDSVNMRMIRDETTLKTKRMVEFTWFRYLTGQVGIAEAFKILKVK